MIPCLDPSPAHSDTEVCGIRARDAPMHEEGSAAAPEVEMAEASGRAGTALGEAKGALGDDGRGGAHTTGAESTSTDSADGGGGGKGVAVQLGGRVVQLGERGGEGGGGGGTSGGGIAEGGGIDAAASTSMNAAAGVGVGVGDFGAAGTSSGGMPVTGPPAKGARQLVCALLPQVCVGGWVCRYYCNGCCPF